jgi:hypothetical protein
MPTKVSETLREKLRTQKRGMNQSRLIDNKSFTKMRMRVLPRAGGTEVPGVPYVSFYGPTLGEDKSTTSPEAFGVACPVLEAYQHIMLTGDDEQKQFLKDNCRITREYWMAVVDQDDPGTPDAPNIKIHRAKKTAYSEIVDLLLDEDDGYDITDLKMGCDIRIRKEGSGLDTEWKVRTLDAGPVSDDAEYIENLKAACKNFDPMKYFYRINLAVLQNLYEVLTGESIPEERLEEIRAKCPIKGQSDEETPEVGMTGGDDDGDGDGDGDADAAEATEEAFFLNEVQVIPGETLVTFEYDGAEITNVVLEVTEDDDGDVCLKVQDENDPDEPWTIYPDNVTNVENPEPEEPAEAEPTEEPKPAKGPSKKKGPAKGAGKKSAPTKSAPKKPAPRKPAAKSKGKSKTGGMKSKLASKKKGRK